MYHNVPSLARTAYVKFKHLHKEKPTEVQALGKEKKNLS